MTATTLSTEDALSAALDADPGNHLLRYALADCLEESAGTVGCPKCKDERFPGYFGSDSLADAFSIELKNRRCHRCSGTGRVSDGRRERAEGYRVLAQLGLRPESRRGQWWWWGKGTFCAEPAGDLPMAWRQTILQPMGFGARYPTRREAEDAAALAWPTLPAETRAKILGAA